MKIVFEPSEASMNKYVSIILDSFKSKNIEVLSLKDLFSSIDNFFNIKVVHLNWYENISDEHFFNVLVNFLKKIFLLFFLLVFRKRVFWTMHNRSPHSARFPFFSSFLIFCLVNFSSKIFIHSLVSKSILLSKFSISSNKIIYCPHPNYIDVYGSIKESGGISDFSPIRILFLGQIRKYKGIKVLLQAFNNSIQNGKNLTLTIAGTIKESYRTELDNLVKGDHRIIFKPGFVHDDELATIFQEHDILAFPYSIESSLNSGSAILAFSYKKTVVCPTIGTIQDIHDKSNVFCYTYSSEQDHIDQLTDQFNLVGDLPISEIKMLGERMFDYVKINNSVDLVASILASTYFTNEIL